MSYDPTEWAPQNPDQQPAQPPVTPPAYGQAPQPPVPPAQGQVAPTQYSAQPPAYGQWSQQPPAPSYGQPSNPGLPPYGQPQQSGQSSNPGLPPYGGPQSNPGLPPYGQPQQLGQPSNPGLPPYGQPQQAGQPSNPGLPPYGQAPQAGQPSNPGLPLYGGPQSNPGLPPYGQAPQAAYGAPAGQYAPQPSNPSLPPYGAPTEQYAPQPQQPWGVPPGSVPPMAPPKKSGAKLLIIILVIVIVLIGGGGGAFVLYQVTQPKPVITTLSSQYKDGSISVGATSTSFTLKGTDFTSNSAITFLLDGNAVPGAPSVQSDSNGGVSATLTVTDAWPVGTHTITAKDANGHPTKVGVKVEIVTPGQANTPGPNGAPTDSANMNIAAIVVAGSDSGPLSLIVTGSANGGSVCRDIDDGKAHTHTGTSIDGVTYTSITVSTCSGTYKNGKLDYTETVTTDKATFSNGLVCTAQVPYVGSHLQGAFTSSTSVNGTYTNNAVTIDCNLGAGSQTGAANSGTWTGVAVVH